MNKAELIESAIKTSKSDISKKEATKLFDSLLEVIGKEVKKNDRVAIPQFGIFKKTKLAARKGRNPQTGDAIKIKASKSVKFTPSASLKKSL